MALFYFSLYVYKLLNEIGYNYVDLKLFLTAWCNFASISMATPKHSNQIFQF